MRGFLAVLRPRIANAIPVRPALALQVRPCQRQCDLTGGGARGLMLGVLRRPPLRLHRLGARPLADTDAGRSPRARRGIPAACRTPCPRGESMALRARDAPGPGQHRRRTSQQDAPAGSARAATGTGCTEAQGRCREIRRWSWGSAFKPRRKNEARTKIMWLRKANPYGFAAGCLIAGDSGAQPLAHFAPGNANYRALNSSKRLEKKSDDSEFI
jgi:hypothetical protein